MKACFSLVALAALLTGCSTTRLTNLTPERFPRNVANLYPFEVAWESKRRGVDANIGAYVLINDQVFPMNPVPKAKNRWEAQITIPPDKTLVPYRYKFVYQYPGVVTTAKRNSNLSQSYRLTISER